MPELTLGQTLDSLVFRMGRVENFIVKLTKLQQLRFNGSKELQTEILEIGNAILKSRIFPNGEEAFRGLRILTKSTGKEKFLIPEKDFEKIKERAQKNILPIECPPCHMRFKNKMALKAHIVNDANWGRRKFRALHKQARLNQVWR